MPEKFLQKISKKVLTFIARCTIITHVAKRKRYANVAHLVERHLAKVEVASSSLVVRSSKIPIADAIGIFCCPERR